MGSQGGFGQSKEFLDLIKSIGESRSKAEEDRIVLREVETLKVRLNDPNTPKYKLKEYIIRLLYVEMLGHDASFGYIHAVKMTHDENLLLKRTGYLAVTLFLNEDHDLIILIVNTIQKDLKSDNFLVVCAALNAVCRLINEETIPAVLPQVVELLGHQKEAVRKKAVMALHRFSQKAPGSVSHLISNFRKKLCDNDPGVMGAALCPLFDLITADVDKYKDLVVSFVNILKQVAERRLPKSYDYHQMPAPFIQIKLLKILSLLGTGDKKASEQMYTIVGDIMRKCDSTSNIGNAILYESICCVSSLHPNPKLLESAADAIAKFLKSDSHNLKYLGIDALTRLIKINPEIAEQHQLAVIDCLEDPDDTLKRKTFDLLYKMTKSSNVEVIVDRMIEYMISINDSHYKTEIASRCVDLAEQFAPSNQWFIQTMNKVFEHAGDLVNAKVAHNLMKLIAEGFGEDDDTADSQLRSSAVESYLRIMGEPKLPSAFLQVICWVLGEYGVADGKYSASYIIGKLCDVAEAHPDDDTVKGYAVTGIMKIYSFEIASGKPVDLLPECQSLIEEMLASHSTDLQQRAYELQSIFTLDAQAVKKIMPMDSTCDDIEIDKNLSFLDGYVQQAIENGAQPYIPESERFGMSSISNFKSHDEHEPSTHALRFEAYELPKPSLPQNVPPVLASSSELVPVPEPLYAADVLHPTSVPSASDSGSSELKLRLDGVQKKWGRPTYSSPVPSSSSTEPVKVQNETPRPDSASSSKPKTRDTSYDSRKQQIEISPEKQKLAASLFGGSSKSEGRQPPSQKNLKTQNHTSDKSRSSKASAPDTAVKTSQPPPDLLDLGEPSIASSVPSVDPFKQFEGLFDFTQETTPASTGGADDATKDSDFTSLFADMSLSAQSHIDPSPESNGLGGSKVEPSAQQLNKGPNLKEALEKDALVRQVGVTPSGQNPILFKDLLG
ncbi:LOW QUALITY PROTEIN: AP-4 complex subunit epsilon [Salvia miltiorrhiza]|uniref:LOW QUALITY PROTEIN: AP-4 complex subunit epsilon n=1 Tax=Salvia miltiorrhiza TaxID=226208 RepID=UPI0025ABC3E4|nr:LOW QUALITY PROTEIN: AP-4 complex subunit epsilon [Salvia miltiorrhiza]